MNYLARKCEVVHGCWDFFTGKAQMERFLPIVTIPTLAGTGLFSSLDAAEAEPHALLSLQHGHLPVPAMGEGRAHALPGRDHRPERILPLPWHRRLHRQSLMASL